MSNRIDDLEASTRTRCLDFLKACSYVGVALRVTHTLRTMDEQLHLYQQGRSAPGPRVTNAAPGESAHNFGMAFDICFEGKTLAECYPGPADPRWEKIGAIGEGLGLGWGGRWQSFKDRPHFERPDWKAAKAA